MSFFRQMEENAWSSYAGGMQVSWMAFHLAPVIFYFLFWNKKRLKKQMT